MGISLNTNLSALNAARNLQASQAKMSSSLQKLTSGSKINSAADDAAGLTISQSLKSQISGTAQAAANVQDGINVTATADGALADIQNILGRMRDLAVQGASDTLSSDARTSITAEATQLASQLTSVVGSTSFNGTNLLNGTAGTNGSISLQVGANAGDTISVNLSNVGADLQSITGAAAVGSTAAVPFGFDVSSNSAASMTLGKIDSALSAINTRRANLGAVENRLSDAADYLSVAQQNLTAAKSTITDTDMASEMVNYTSASVLSQAGVSLLSQANSSSQSLLKLFG